jgi:hypothetical protein
MNAEILDRILQKLDGILQLSADHLYKIREGVYLNAVTKMVNIFVNVIIAAAVVAHVWHHW